MSRALLVSVLLIWSLANCNPARSLPPAVVSSPIPMEAAALALVPTATPSPTPHPTCIPPPTASPSFTATPPSSPTPTATPASSPTPTATLYPAPTFPPPAYAPAAGEPLSFSLGWHWNSNGHLTDGVATWQAGQPSFLVASLDRRVYALTESGEVLWNARASGPAYVLAVLEGERIAVGDDGGYVTLFDAHGRRLWRHNMGSRVTALQGSWQGGLLAGGWDEHLTLLRTDGAEDRVRWQADLGSPVSSIATLSSLALVATLDGQVRAFDAAGSEVWHVDAGASVTNLGTVAGPGGTVVLVGVQDGRLLAFHVGERAATFRWQHALGQGAPEWYVADLMGNEVPEIVAGTGGTDPLLAMLTAEGDLLWRIVLPSPVGALSVLDLDRDGALEILAGLASGDIQAYDGQGRLRGSINAGLPIWDLAPAGPGAALALADVVAWRIAGVPGPVGGPWLPAPAMLPLPLDRWPAAAGQATSQASTGEGATLVFLGDVALGRSTEAQLVRYGPAYSWQGLGGLLAEADLAVANLECVLSTRGRPLEKQYVIRAHPRWGQTLLTSGLDLVTIANNHALDFGQVGLDETLATLDDLGIATVGAGSLRDPLRTRRPALFDLNEVQVAVLSYAAARWNGSIDVPATDRVAWASSEAVEADVRAAKDQADVVIVILHAGTEYAVEPSPDQVAVAHSAVDAGADLVVGHHPHVTQTVERYGQGLIVYSLGDALFDIPRPAAMQGNLLRVHVVRKGLVRAELWPFWIEDSIRLRLLDDGSGTPCFTTIFP